MLNLTEIANRIQHPELCEAKDIDSLKSLCETYPYSQVFPLLYLKTLAQTNDVRLDVELQNYAYRIANRAVLFDLLHAKSNVNATKTSEEELPEVIIDSIPEEQPIIEHEVERPVSIIEEEKEEIEITTVEQEVEIHTTEEVKTEELEVAPIDDELNSLILPSEFYSLEAEEKKIRETQPEKEEEIPTEEVDLEEEKRRLIAALTSTKQLTVKPEIQPEEKTEEKTSSIEKGSERSFTSWLKSSQTSLPEKEDAKKEDKSALIDRFIKTEPKISSPKEKLFEDREDKNELYNPTKKAKESLDDSQLPVSETLAKIFAAQGNYPKAIFAYQQLMLIFPEKKVFFATQIEELNKKLNT